LLLLLLLLQGRKMLGADKAEKADFLPLLLMAGKGMAKMQKQQVAQQNVVSVPQSTWFLVLLSVLVLCLWLARAWRMRMCENTCSLITVPSLHS
jgi:H+/gluconate symporter-like permease